MEALKCDNHLTEYAKNLLPAILFARICNFGDAVYTVPESPLLESPSPVPSVHFEDVELAAVCAL